MVFGWQKAYLHPLAPTVCCPKLSNLVQLPSFMTVSEPKRMKSSTSTPSIQFSSANDLKKTSWSGTMQCRIKETIASLASETSRHGRSHITGWEVVCLGRWNPPKSHCSGGKQISHVHDVANCHSAILKIAWGIIANGQFSFSTAKCRDGLKVQLLQGSVWAQF